MSAYSAAVLPDSSFRKVLIQRISHPFTGHEPVVLWSIPESTYLAPRNWHEVSDLATVRVAYTPGVSGASLPEPKPCRATQATDVGKAPTTEWTCVLYTTAVKEPRVEIDDLERVESRSRDP